MQLDRPPAGDQRSRRLPRVVEQRRLGSLRKCCGTLRNASNRTRAASTAVLVGRPDLKIDACRLTFRWTGLRLPREARDLPDDRSVSVREAQSTLLEDTEHRARRVDERAELFPAQL